MKFLKKLIILVVVALSVTLIIPSIAPCATVSTVEAAKVKISKSKLYLTKGKSEILKIKGTSSKVKWTTSNKKIAKVNSKGKVTGVSKGTTTITAKVNGKKYKCKVTIETPSLSSNSIVLINGDSYALKVNGSKQKVTWSSSNKKIATVSSKGKIKTISKGNVNIYAKVGGKKYTCKLTVETPSISNTSLSITVGDSRYIFLNGNTQKITWSSSNESVATVSNGYIKTKNTGNATITAKVGSRTFSCYITVNPVPIKKYSAGHYKVGIDMPAGEYVLFSNSSIGYFAISSDSSGSLYSIITNDNFSYNSIITVKTGQYLELTGCYAMSLNDASISTTSEGMFLVGKHIKEGEYKLQSTGYLGYFAVYSSSTQELDKIITNGNFTGTRYITVENGQYLKLRDCKIVN